MSGPELKVSDRHDILTVEVPSWHSAECDYRVGNRSYSSTREEEEETNPPILVLALIKPSLPRQVQPESAKDASGSVISEVLSWQAAEALVSERENGGRNEGGDAKVVQSCAAVEDVVRSAPGG